MTHIYRRRFRVRGYKVGASAEVHDSVFLHYVQQAEFEASADAGYYSRRYDTLGSIWVIRRQTDFFRAALSYTDAVELTTRVSDLHRVRSHREYEMRRVSDERVVALAQADWVYIDATTLFPRRIPPEMIEVFRPKSRCALDAAPSLGPKQALDGRSSV